MSRRASIVLAGLGLSLLLASLLSPFASSSPDGLERVAQDQGFLERAESNGEAAPMKDYIFPGIGSERAATAAAGLVGTLGVFLLAWGLASLLRKKVASEP
jgi:cobalt/nickel transport protein